MPVQGKNATPLPGDFGWPTMPQFLLHIQLNSCGHSMSSDSLQRHQVKDADGIVSESPDMSSIWKTERRSGMGTLIEFIVEKCLNMDAIQNNNTMSAPAVCLFGSPMTTGDAKTHS